MVIRGNSVDGSGCRKDPRMHGRGSCSWVIICTDVLVEHNRFANAWGINDSCGFHIDIGNRNVVVQYNLSLHNAGGFVEILGANRNCAYRYNISVDDGWRVKGEDGATNEGHLLWTLGFRVPPKAWEGPYHSYIYNNTVYVGERRSCFSLGATTDGLLIANNIFHLLGPTTSITTAFQQQHEPPGGRIRNVVFRNNLYLRPGLLPADLPVTDAQPLTGDAAFARPGGTEAADYLPTNTELVRDRGIAIEKLPGDEVGLTVGLAVDKDILGRPVTGRPDLGAVELAVP
jgi:hypothetical protein